MNLFVGETGRSLDSGSSYTLSERKKEGGVALFHN